MKLQVNVCFLFFEPHRIDFVIRKFRLRHFRTIASRKRDLLSPRNNQSSEIQKTPHMHVCFAMATFDTYLSFTGT